MLILTHADVSEALAGREKEVADLVAQTYRLHDEGRTAVPHSLFLRFPDSPRDRIIALPAYLGGPEPIAGVKWISSFPGNLDAGLDRASAAIIVNSVANGHPEALLEASLISAERTAASAALAAVHLVPRDAEVTGVALVGGGVINAAVLRHLAAAFPALREATLYDASEERARSFARRTRGEVDVRIARSPPEAIAAHELVSIATTAATPHVTFDDVRPDATVLHVSLRDITPEAILASRNVVDDVDHVSRENTSIDLAARQAGNHDFVDATLGGLLTGRAGLHRRPGDAVVFSPFGLGALDLALARFVLAEAAAAGTGTRVDGFLPGGH